MARRTYTDSDRALVKVALEANNGSVKAAARETGMPVQTVRDMKHKWDREGLPATVMEALPAVVSEFVGNAERVRDKSLAAYEVAVDAGEVKPKELLLGVGILTDKVRLVTGQATSRTESVQGQMTPSEVRDLFAGFAMGVVAAARSTHSEIVDAEWTEQADERTPLLELLPQAN